MIFIAFGKELYQQMRNAKNILTIDNSRLRMYSRHRFPC